MTRSIFLLVLLILVRSSHAGMMPDTSASDYRSVWECDNPKFSWYCDEEAPAPKVEAAPPPVKTIREMTTVEEVRKEMERLHGISIMFPTDANMRAALDAQQYVMNKGAVYADVWRRVVWKTPELDYSLKRPVNNVAIKTYDAERQKKEVKTLAELGKENGIFFFFRSDCPYCHKLAPTLKYLAAEHGLEIFPISVDGGGLPEYPRPRINKGQAEALGITTVPALFLGSKKSGELAPIGYGMLSITEIVDRIYTLTNTKPGDSF